MIESMQDLMEKQLGKPISFMVNQTTSSRLRRKIKTEEIVETLAALDVILA